MLRCCRKRHVTIVSDDNPSTSAGTRSTPGYGAPEEILPYVVGSCNRWRVLVIFVFCVIMVFDGLNLFAAELLVPQHLDFKCNEGGNLQENSCYTRNGSRCHKFLFSHRYGYTLTEKWELVCEKRVQVTLCNVIFRFGMAVGFAIVGFFADKWGRKKVLFISLILQSCTGIIVTASKFYTFFVIARFFYGFALSGTVLIAMVLTCEISPNGWRTFDLGLICLSFAIGHVALPYVWMIFADSMKNVLLMSIPQVLLIAFIGVIRESPNWLLCENQPTKAESVLLTVARFNGQKMPSSFRLRPVQITNTSSRRSVRVVNILKPSRTRWIIVALCVIWFLTTFTSGLLMAHYWAQNDDLLNMILYSGVASLAAALLSLILCHIMEHKLIIALSSILACITSTVSYIVNGQAFKNRRKLIVSDVTSYGLFQLALFTVWNMTARVFPTEMRAQGTGLAVALGELSFTLARVLLMFVYSNLITALITLWCCTVVLVLCCMLLWSVHKRELPDVLDDTINFRNTYKPTRWSTLRATSPTIDETEVKIVDFERGTSLSVQQLSIPFYFGKFRKKVTQT